MLFYDAGCGNGTGSFNELILLYAVMQVSGSLAAIILSLRKTIIRIIKSMIRKKTKRMNYT